MPARSLFILIGAAPHTGWLEGVVERDAHGFVLAGDVRHGSVKRVASSVGEGSIAISFVHQYMSRR